MTRRTTKLAAVYLLLGLAAIWVVAWGLVLACPMHAAHRSKLEFPGDSRGDMATGLWYLTSWSFARPGSVRRMWYVQADEPGSIPSSPWGAYAIRDMEDPIAAARQWAVGGPLAWGDLGRAVREFQEGGTPMHGLEDARGWPALALGVRYAGFDPYRPGTLRADGGIMLPPLLRTRSQAFIRRSGADAATVRALPLTPLWPGLLADTLFYALLFASLHQLTAWGRRARRRGRGRCAACGYDLTGIDGVCPECGAAR